MSILADRYASSAMKEIWSAESKIRAERNLWITVMKTQAKLGFDIPAQAISDYEKVRDQIDLASIGARESISKHDVKARIDEFNELAGQQYIHIGMTSRDLTENIELFQLSSSLLLVQMKVAALFKFLAHFASENHKVPFVARTHNVPAQLITVGRRAATWIEELLFGFENLQNLSVRIPLKGIKGPVGTGQDLIDLFGESSHQIEDSVASILGFGKVLSAPSQIYPRSIDYEIVTALVQLAAAPSNIATNIRIMSGFGLVTEGFEAEQVGSSAMPHKINARLSERVNALNAVLKGNAVMIQELVGNQWNEGDVSCSVVRRIALPDSFYAIDAILDTTMRIIQDLNVRRERIEQEVKEFLPFLASTKMLSEAIKNGMGREDAHARIKAYSLAANENLRKYGSNNLIDLISVDSSLGFTSEFLNSIQDPSNFISNAVGQTWVMIDKALEVAESLPASLTYKPAFSI